MPKETPDLFTKNASLKDTRYIYTVSQLTQNIKLVLENTFAQVWVEGEVSGFSTYPSGHSYFTLKDDSSILPAVLFVRIARDVKFKIADGLKVICFGKISAYASHAGGGKYQIIVEKIEPKGIGSLQLALEQLKEKLEKEGLFAVEHKKPMPYLPSRIGVVTSLTGAAIKDILKVLDRRFKDVNIIINPVRVQGDGAKEDIAQAIQDFNRLNQQVGREAQIDVLIVGRGGGSIEDLWAFNEEIVARAIYDSRIPIISAVGHERDWTIADLVADLRAPTPSVAAELVIPKKEDVSHELDSFIGGLRKRLQDLVLSLNETMDDLIHRLSLNVGHIWELNRNQCVSATKKLTLLNPAALIPQYKTRMLDLAKQIYVRMDHLFKLKNSQFIGLIEKLSSLNPLNILARGYSVTFKMPEGKIIKEAKSIKTGDTIKTRVYKGDILSEVTEVS
jgi:exodeoxyribonuclease VII large subunit